MSEVAQHISEKRPIHHYSPASGGCEVKMQLSCNNSQKTENRRGDLTGKRRAVMSTDLLAQTVAPSSHSRVILLLSLK
jgi:hypothetical protein